MKRNVRNIFSDRDFQKYRKLNENEEFVESTDEQNLTEDEEPLNEDITEKKGMSDEELKVEALKIATSIAKLMSNVTAQDVVSIAGTVSDFIRNHEIGDAQTDEEFLTKDDEVESTESEEKPKETAEEPEAEEFKTGDEEVSDESES